MAACRAGKRFGVTRDVDENDPPCGVEIRVLVSEIASVSTLPLGAEASGLVQ